MTGLGSQNAIKNQSKNQSNFEGIFKAKSGLGYAGDAETIGQAVCRRWVPGILNLPIRHTFLDTPCSPRGGRRIFLIEDASRRHTAAPLLLD